MEFVNINIEPPPKPGTYFGLYGFMETRCLVAYANGRVERIVMDGGTLYFGSRNFKTEDLKWLKDGNN